MTRQEVPIAQLRTDRHRTCVGILIDIQRTWNAVVGRDDDGVRVLWGRKLVIDRRQHAIHRARSLGVFDRCAFVGKQPRIVDYLCAADVLLLPSEQESFGLAALEAMACEVPVIASRVGGVPEVVDDGETGFLSEVGDIEKMANDAARLLSDEKFRSEMGRRARESAISRYNTDLVIPRYIEFYEKILAKDGVAIGDLD